MRCRKGEGGGCKGGGRGRSGVVKGERRKLRACIGVGGAGIEVMLRS